MLVAVIGNYLISTINITDDTLFEILLFLDFYVSNNFQLGLTFS